MAHCIRKVGWLRASDQTVLALEERVVTHNVRISVAHEDMRTWRLRIKQLRESDRGELIIVQKIIVQPSSVEY